MSAPRIDLDQIERYAVSPHSDIAVGIPVDDLLALVRAVRAAAAYQTWLDGDGDVPDEGMDLLFERDAAFEPFRNEAM